MYIINCYKYIINISNLNGETLIPNLIIMLQ